MTRRNLIPALIAATILAVSSCIEPPLHLKQSVEVIVKVLWKVDVYPDGVKPDGVTLYFFRNGEFYMQHTTSQVDSCVVQLAPGNYKLYMITQSPEEYWKMEFFDMTDFEKARVSATETKSNWYTRANEEVLINNPEMMAVGVSAEFEVPESLLYEHNRIATKAGENVVYYTVTVPVDPQSVVSQYWVTIYSDNVDVLKSVRASTSGMARSFNLTQGKTGDEEGTQFITEWTLTVDDEARRVGHLDGRVTTFGFPRGELPSPNRDSTLNVSTLLVDNKTVEEYRFYVGDKIHLEEPVPQGYRHLYRIIFGSIFEPAIHPKDVKPDEGGGFEAQVSDWDEEENVNVEM